jgi:hypothetical protein
LGVVAYLSYNRLEAFALLSFYRLGVLALLS